MRATWCLSLCPLSQSESQDQVFLRWTSGETATMHILVVHAMVILLTLGPPRCKQFILGFSKLGF